MSTKPDRAQTTGEVAVAADEVDQDAVVPAAAVEADEGSELSSTSSDKLLVDP